MAQTSETIRKDNRQKALQEEDEVTARAKAAFAELGLWQKEVNSQK